MNFTYASGAQPVQGYTIRRGLGRGGFGEVYLAVSDGGKEVALKLVQQHLDVELRGVGQCINLKHPHLVGVYNILKTQNDDTGIVMEYMGGESLDQVLARHPHGIPEPQALGWLHGICSGVRYLHEHGIVHRDLKPGNLFIEHGVVKIGDYGLSKFISASRRGGQTVSIGSVHYMAPEMSHGRYGNEVDQYALGVILCEMLTGRVPFDGESQGEILMKHLTADPDLGRLTEPYRSVVARLLDKDQRNRYPAVQDLLAELPALDPAMPGAFPDPVTADLPGQRDQSETEIRAAAPDLPPAESEPANPRSDEEAGVKVGLGLATGYGKEFTEKIDGKSKVRENGPNENYIFNEKIDGASNVAILAPGGSINLPNPVNFFQNGGSKIDGKSKVLFEAASLTWHRDAKIDGQSIVLIIVSKDGHVKLPRISGKSHVYWSKASVDDPQPKVEQDGLDWESSVEQVSPDQMKKLIKDHELE